MRFLIVWFGQLVSLLGSALTAFALDVWVFERTGSISQFALTVLFFVLPRLVLAPFAGAVADQFDRRKIMLLADAGSAAGTALMALWLLAGQLDIGHVYLYNVFNAACAAFQRPAYSASMALLVPPAQLGRANGLRQLARSSADLLAPPVAGLLFGLIGLQGIIWIDLTTFIVGASCLAWIRFPSLPETLMVARKPVGSLRTLLANLWREALDGWRWVKARPGLSRLNLMYAATSLFGVTTEMLMRPYVLSTSGSLALGWVVSAQGAGLLIGGLLMGILGAPRRAVLGLLAFEVLVSLCTLLLGLRVSVVGLAGVYLVYFAGVSFSDGYSELVWQTHAPMAHQGRIFALRDMISMSAFALGLAVTGPLAEFVLEPALQVNGVLSNTIGSWIGVGPGRGIALIFILTGLFNVVMVIWTLLNPAVRDLDSTATACGHIQSAP